MTYRTSSLEMHRIAFEFVETHLEFADNRWRGKLVQRLAAILDETVTKSVSTTDNRILREAILEMSKFAENAQCHLPYDARKCQCKDLDNGEHAQQPLCSHCSIQYIQTLASRALESREP